MARTHHLPDEQVHFTWDTGNEPRVVVDSGDTVVVWTRDVSDNQIGPESDVSVIAGLDWERVYPLLGPIGVHGAEPGDTLAIEVLDIRTQGGVGRRSSPGWASCPRTSRTPICGCSTCRTATSRTCATTIAIPLEPFFGTMGVCPAGATAQPVMPPGIFGGNMDVRQIVRGSTLYLPVQIEQALFSCGDAHACQGDGEVCVTGLEAPMFAALRLTLEKGRSIPAPQYRTPGR